MLAVNGETKEEHFFFEVFFLLKRFYFLVVLPKGTFPGDFFLGEFLEALRVGLGFSPHETSGA